ncbi:unnamed protein product [Gongylonema pulchrum]|uniref:Uncharacterized protein n=1 Tax=Gongylonema pulchrum TaxID=637853 RepID=A0A183EGX6_9BILA|nr:unnamed protein product [Gongylonema pulchrum]
MKHDTEAASSICSWAFVTEHDKTSLHLNMVEEENALLRKEVNQKSEVIAQWIRSLPDTGRNAQIGTSSPGLRFRRMLEMVRIDETAADIRDMNRRLQRMLEETLSENLVLQRVGVNLNCINTLMCFYCKNFITHPFLSVLRHAHTC